MSGVRINISVFVPAERGWVSKIEVEGEGLFEYPLPYTVDIEEGGCRITCEGVFDEGTLLQVAYKSPLSVIHRMVVIVDPTAEGGWREIGTFERTRDMIPLIEKLNVKVARR
ncbi:MAG: hypothetical protein QW292_02880 [Candidatus Parvarchaeota archaeon]